MPDRDYIPSNLIAETKAFGFPYNTFLYQVWYSPERGGNDWAIRLLPRGIMYDVLVVAVALFILRKVLVYVSRKSPNPR